MRKVSAIFAALALSAVAVAPARGQAAPAPAAKAAALDVMDAIGFDAMIDRDMRNSIATARNAAVLSAQIDAVPQLRAARAKNPKAWDAALKRIGAKQAGALQAVFTELRPAYRERVMQAYAQTFTVPELKQLAGFYRSPIGRKLNTTMPQALGRVNMWMAQQRGERLAKRMAAIKPAVDKELAPLMPKPAGR